MTFVEGVVLRDLIDKSLDDNTLFSILHSVGYTLGLIDKKLGINIVIG